MIRDIVIHMNGEQPLVADIEAMPTATDTCLVCTNLRYIDGKKPTFVDFVDSWFMVPMALIRFVEVPKRSLEPVEGLIALPAGRVFDDVPEMDAESSAAFLRRIAEA